MTPEQIEQAIRQRSDAVLHYQRLADESQDLMERGRLRDEARRAAADVARLVGMRTPETVLAMERDRGLV